MIKESQVSLEGERDRVGLMRVFPPLVPQMLHCGLQYHNYMSSCSNQRYVI